MPSHSFVPGARWLTGTGSPEGVVAAPVGTVWTDTTGTFGAVEWTKFTGTGTTGWRVTKGDTGDVDVTAQITIAGAAPSIGDAILVRRTTVGGIAIRVSLAGRATWPTPVIVTLPPWARPAPLRTLASRNGTTPAHMVYLDGSENLRIYSLVSGTALAEFSAPPSTAATPWRTA